MSFGSLSIKIRYKLKSMSRPAIVANCTKSLFDLPEIPARRPINNGITTINRSKNKSVFILVVKRR